MDLAFAVMSYQLQLSKGDLVLEGLFGDKLGKIVFSQVLAYRFTDGGKENYLAEIAENSLDSFARWYEKTQGQAWGFTFGLPLGCGTTASAVQAYLAQKGCHYYELNASVGLDGFVLAKGFEMIMV